MNAYSKTFPLHHAMPRHHYSRSLWRESGVGLAIVLTVLVMTVVGIRGNAGDPMVGSWPATVQPAEMTGWVGNGSPGLLPLDPMTIDAPM